MNTCFLSAFDQYLRINWAVKGTGDEFQIKYNLTKPFSAETFLKSITKENPFCKTYMGSSKDKTVNLYRKFIGTTMFRKYLVDKKKEIKLEQHMI